MSQRVLMARIEHHDETDTSGGAVPRNLLRDAVFARLLGRILRGEYRRGQRLRLDTIAADMQVSRTPVREALMPLETLGLVRVERYVGVVIADWGVEHMVERIHIVQHMLDVPVATAESLRAIQGFEPAWTRDCLSEVGVFCVLAQWLLRRLDRPVSADWLATQQPLLDMFYTPEVARAHCIDIAVGQADRAGVLADACRAASADDLRRVMVALDAFADRIADVQTRFRPGASR